MVIGNELSETNGGCSGNGATLVVEVVDEVDECISMFYTPQKRSSVCVSSRRVLKAWLTSALTKLFFSLNALDHSILCFSYNHFFFQRSRLCNRIRWRRVDCARGEDRQGPFCYLTLMEDVLLCSIDLFLKLRLNYFAKGHI